jgi:thiamine kinase-like enzyme
MERTLRLLPENDEGAIRDALAALGLPRATIAEARIARLKGLTNRVYRIDAAGESFCVRIPGAGTAEIIDRHAEEASARGAALAGIAPEVLHFGTDGVMVTRFVEAETMSPAHFRASAGAVERAAAALRRLHETARSFPRSFDLFGTIDRYAALLRTRGAELPDGFDALMAITESIRGVLQARPAEEKPCHCDPTGANLLDTGARVFLIDWEYSGQNDPVWDLAYLSVEASFDAAQDQRLLAAYFGRAPSTADIARTKLYKALCQFLSALWALIQHTGGNPAAEFRDYAARTFEKCRRRMQAEDFEALLKAVRSR